MIQEGDEENEKTEVIVQEISSVPAKTPSVVSTSCTPAFKKSSSSTPAPISSDNRKHSPKKSTKKLAKYRISEEIVFDFKRARVKRCDSINSTNNVGASSSSAKGSSAEEEDNEAACPQNHMSTHENQGKRRTSPPQGSGNQKKITMNNSSSKTCTRGKRMDDIDRECGMPAGKRTESATANRDSPQSCLSSFQSLVSKKHMVQVNGKIYLKLATLGRGGSCKVFKVLAPNAPHQILALKRIKLPKIDRKTLANYQNEIELMKRLHGHSNIIQLVDSEIDTSRKVVYMVMEAGETDLAHRLQDLKQKNDSGDVDENFLRVTWQSMLEAVHTIHEERIVHSDLKPANFLFVKGVLKLIDFGIAKAIASEDTTNIYRENQIGTINYMSPEALIDTSSQRSGMSRSKKSMVMKLGRASDIWSLGCILYQMIYGYTPFSHLRLVQKLHAITSDGVEIEYPKVQPKYKAALEVVKLCLQRDPKKRPSITGPGGLLEHRFLRPEKRKCQHNELMSQDLTLGVALLSSLDSRNVRADSNGDILMALVKKLLSAGKAMQKHKLDSSAFLNSVAGHLVEQLQKQSNNGSEDSAKKISLDTQSALAHAQRVEHDALQLHGKSRPKRDRTFAGELKKKKTDLVKVTSKDGSCQRNQKDTQTTKSNGSLAAVLQNGLAKKYKSTTLRSPTCNLNASVGESWLDDEE